MEEAKGDPDGDEAEVKKVDIPPTESENMKDENSLEDDTHDMQEHLISFSEIDSSLYSWGKRYFVFLLPLFNIITERNY